VSLGVKFLTFWRIILPSWPWRWKYYYSSKRWELFTQQHIVTTQMTWILSSTIFRTLNLTLLPVQFVVVLPRGGEHYNKLPLIQFSLPMKSYIIFMKYAISQMPFRNATDEHIKNILSKFTFIILFINFCSSWFILVYPYDNKICQMLPENSSCNVMYILLRSLLFLPLISCYKFFIVIVKILKIKKDQPIWLYWIYKQNFGGSSKACNS